MEVDVTTIIIPFPNKREHQRRRSVSWAPEAQAMMLRELAKICAEVKQAVEDFGWV